MRRREPGPAELEALDPLTGESLSSSHRGDAGVDATDLRRKGAAAARARRLRTAAVVAACLAVSCAAAAGYFAVSIAQLRGVERTWRTAMALDAARAAADRQVRELAGGRPGPSSSDDDAVVAPLQAVGSEVVRGLRGHERSLADRRIVDSKVSDLRDAMVEALEFRRFQLTPTRNRIGDTPLQQVEQTIDDQLDRWGLAPSTIDPPELASLEPALARLRRFADVETGATLFALGGATLHTIDVDRSDVRRRPLPLPTSGHLVAVSGGVAVVGGGRLWVYGPDPSDEPLATIDADVSDAVPAGDGSGDVWVVQQGGRSVRRFHVDGAASGWATEPATLPPGRTLVGATSDGLVLESPGEGLEAWSTSLDGPVTMLASQGARFLDAEGTLVLFQGPLPLSPRAGSQFLHRYDVATDRRELIGLPRTDAATADIGPEGVVALAAGPLAGRLGSMLFLQPGSAALTGGATAGPRASVERGSIAWAGDGQSVFWLTPDGDVGIAYGTDPPARQRLRTPLTGLDRIAVLGR